MATPMSDETWKAVTRPHQVRCLVPALVRATKTRSATAGLSKTIVKKNGKDYYGSLDDFSGTWDLQSRSCQCDTVIRFARAAR